MIIEGFELKNAHKLDRAINGTPGSKGVINGGVGSSDEGKIIAEYDRLGGFIVKDGYKLKTGCFWDFKNNCVFKKPQIIFLVKVGDKEVEVPEGEPMPKEVEAQAILAKTSKRKPAKKSLQDELGE